MLQHFLMRAWQQGKGKIETEKWLRRKEEKVDQRSLPRGSARPSAKEGDQKTETTKLIKTPAEVLDEDLDAAYAELLPDQKKLAQKLFKRITTQRDGKGTRDPARLKQVADFAETSPPEMRKVIDVFRRENRSFVEPLTGHIEDDVPVDITHEAVIYSWGELKRSIREEAEQARTLEDLWRKSQSGKTLTREEMDEGRKLLDPPNPLTWAERYAFLYQERYGGEVKSVRKFLDESMADADRRDLQIALQEGRVWDVEPLTRRGVRLTDRQLKDFRFEAHYYALRPEELLKIEDDSGASSPGETEASLRQHRKKRIEEVFTHEVCAKKQPDGKILSRKTDRGQSVAHFAAWGGSIEILEHLASIGAPLNDENERGNTPFFWAVAEDKLVAAKWLVHTLGPGNTIGKVSDVTGRTALHSAASAGNGSASVVGWLLTEGANANAVDNFGRTPLHEAAGERDLARVETLLANPANPANAAHSGEDGLTALMALFVYRPDDEDRQSAPRKPILDALLRNGAERSLSSSYRGSSSASPCHRSSRSRRRARGDRGGAAREGRKR